MNTAADAKVIPWTKQRVLVTIEVTVDDPAQLRRFATARAIMDGMTAQEWEDTRNGVASDVQMILDPGRVEDSGVTIESSSVEEYWS